MKSATIELPPELASLVTSRKIEVARDIQVSAIDSVDTAGIDELRALVKQLLVEKIRPIEPLGIDAFAGLPVFMDKPECPRCKPFSEARIDPVTTKTHHVCHDCNGAIPHSIEFFNRGVESPSVDHLHLHTVRSGGGQQIRTPARRELCIPCFRIDWAKVHPDKVCDL